MEALLLVRQPTARLQPREEEGEEVGQGQEAVEEEEGEEEEEDLNRME
jgi:hypothetical protein